VQQGRIRSAAWNESTRERLLEVAGEIFATRGFEGATVAEITRKAGVNVASINYHFRDKLGLYVAILARGLPHREMGSQVTSENAEEEFVLFVTNFVRNLIGAGRPSWGSRLMAREIAQPTPALATVIRKIIRPNYERLREIIGAFFNKPADSEAVRLAAHSVVGQCVHWAHAGPVLPHIWPALRLDPPQVERIAAHIAAFSLAGLKATRSASGRRAKSKRKR
jgi:TetR/AcrR family transcriptional regulator, regulator of cefoperazone and chloramphenicol sensitivity